LKVVGQENLSRFVGDGAAIKSLSSWLRICEAAVWHNLADVRDQFGTADPVGSCTVFNIRHNRYRLIARIYYATQIVQIIAVLTHAEYTRGGWKHACGG
jgi:mRNA interferase HigB